MYNLWWIFIAFAIIFGIGLTLWIVGANRRYTSGLEESGIVISGISIILVILCFFLALLLPMSAKQEYNEFVETQEMVEEVYKDYNTLENVGLTQKIIELNQWLAKAKSSKETFGNWSMYCGLDLDSLEYIQLKSEKV